MKDKALFGKEEVEIVSELPGLTIVRFKDGHVAGVIPEDLEAEKIEKAEEKKPKAKKAKAGGA